MPRTILFAIAIAGAIGVAASLRLPGLGNRTMHCDEANQAVKFGRLLERGEYRYDPREHHGPTLVYATLPVAWAVSARTLPELSEVQLRLVPAVAGILLVALAWTVCRALGPLAAASAAWLAAVSPAMVFYSRYYIMEMLLVVFTFAAMAALWRYCGAQHKPAADRGAEKEDGPSTPISGATSGRGLVTGLPWLVFLGLAVGLMHATKETCIIALAALAVAAVTTLPGLWRLGAARLGQAFLLAGVVAAVVSALLFSSFFHTPQGVADSYTAFGNYMGRAAGEGSVGPQVKPWDYYLRMLFWRGGSGVHLPGEIFTAGLALLGLLAAAWGKVLKPETRPVARFVAVYALLMTVAYSAMPYKTPWSALGMLHGLILLAGVGAAALVHVAPGRLLKGAVVVVLATGAGHLAWEASQASFTFQNDSAMNPYVHTPTSPSAVRLAERVHEVAAVHPEGQAMHVQVICPDGDYWPLPWYLRDMTRVGWHSEVPQGGAAPLLITRPELEAAVIKYLYEDQPKGHRYLVVPFPTEGDAPWLLRSGVPLQVFLRHELLEVYRSATAEEPPTQTP